MSIEQREIHMKIDALVTAVDRLANRVAFGSSTMHNEIVGPFRQALDDVERMKFDSMTEHLGVDVLLRDPEQEKDVIHLKEIEDFIRRYGKAILDRQSDDGLKIRMDEQRIRRYSIHLGKFDPHQHPFRINVSQNPRLRLDFEFDYYIDTPPSWNLIENVRLVTEGGPSGYPPIVAEPIPDKLIRRETWKTILRHALNAIDCHEVMDELETSFPKEPPAERY